ncbi:MAG: hypothetical protein CL908_08625 [Deltaproteobacteria bacterium]|nr:hypothetical protein [Deltaproteobacteria bacterium]
MRESISKTKQLGSNRAIAMARVLAGSGESSGPFGRSHLEGPDEDPGDRAVVAGNRAGVVEWVSSGWTRITGLTLSETVDKPITHFLESAQIELSLVDFVSQHFLEGRPCRVQLPFERADGRRVRIHLEVEPIRDERGEVAEFVAVAWEIGEQHPLKCKDQPRTARPATNSVMPNLEPAPPEVDERAQSIALSERVEWILQRVAHPMERRTHLDVCLAPDLEPLTLRPDLFDALVAALLEAAQESVRKLEGFVTVLTGRGEAMHSHLSAVHAIPARPRELARGPYLYLEVHDTGPHLAAAAADRIRRDETPRNAHERSLVRAQQLALAVGASFHLDSTPGCGSQSLVLFQIPAHSSRAPELPGR